MNLNRPGFLGDSDGDRVFWSQLTWISGEAVRLLLWWILSYSIGVRISRAVWRRCRLWKIGPARKHGMGWVEILGLGVRPRWNR